METFIYAVALRQALLDRVAREKVHSVEEFFDTYPPEITAIVERLVRLEELTRSEARLVIEQLDELLIEQVIGKKKG